MGKTAGTCRRALAAVVLLSATAGVGCAVSDSDVHRWETTEGGPEKLYAIVTHDKYTWALREEAAMSLVHMRPRSGKRIGLEYLVLGFEGSTGKVPAALSVLNDESRKHIVDDIAPKLIDVIQQPPPTRSADAQTIPPDPSIPYKDAAFGMLSHEPPLVSDDKTKADLTAALTQWVQTDFEDRIDNSSQQFGVEQIMRAIGPSAVKVLPASIVEGNTKNDKASQLIADIGDDDTKTRAGQALVALAKTIDSPAWVEKQRGLVMEANKKSGNNATPAQVTAQLSTYQEQELEKVFTNMKRVGGRPVVDYCLAYAQDKSKSEKMRSDALAALENRMDKNFPADVTALFNIVGDDTNPDSVRGMAGAARRGEARSQDDDAEGRAELHGSPAHRREDEDVAQRADHVRSAHHEHGPGLGSEAAGRAQPVPELPQHGRQAHRGRVVLPGQEVRQRRGDRHRGRQGTSAEVRRRRQVRVGVLRRQGQEGPHDRGRVREVLR
jgi:hypothetical protein